MSFTKFSMRNSVLVHLLTVFILVTGIYSVFQIKREVFPIIELDRVVIQTSYPGATAVQIEKLITNSIERELKEVDDLKQVGSISAEGISIINVTIEPDATDKNKVINDIQRAVDRVDDFPSDLKDKPLVEEVSTKGDPLLEVALAGNVDPKLMRQEVRRLENMLLDLKGVSSVNLRGYQDPEVVVQLDPEKLKQYHISLTEVAYVLKNTNINVPGGKIIDQGQEYLLRVSGEFFKEDEIGELIVRSNDAGFYVKLKDLGKVVLGFEEIPHPQRTNGKDAVSLLVIKKINYDAIRLKQEVNVLLARFQKNLSPSMSVSIHNDLTYFIQRRLGVLLSNGTYGMVFLLVPLLMFLSKRATLSAVLGLTIAFLGTITLMSLLGISINLLSMFGLILVSGMLVDEDLVMAENIQRHLEDGKPYEQAVLQGAEEVSAPIIATVLTTITAFLPLLFMSDITGKFVRQIPLVIIIALSVSLLEALIILPNHMMEFSRQAKDKLVQVKRGRIMLFLDRHYTAFLKGVNRLGVMAIPLSLILVVGTLGFIFWGYKTIPYVHFPSGGIDRFFIRVELPQGTPVQTTMKKMQEIEAILATLPKTELEDYITFGGIVQTDPRDDFTQREPYLGQILVHLVPEVDRSRDITAIMNDLRSKTNLLQGFVKISYDEIVHNPSKKKPVEIKFRGDEIEKLQAASADTLAYLQKLEGVYDARSDLDLGNKELRAVLSPALLAQAGLSFEEVALAVRTAMEGVVATQIRETEEEIDVLVRFPESLRKSKGALQDIMIANQRGQLIPLRSLGIFSAGDVYASIKHEDRKRLVTLSANLDIKKTTALDVHKKISETLEKLEVKYPGVMINFGGELEDIEESLGGLARAFAVALFLIFVIIAVTLKSILKPLMIMFTIPLGMTGIVFAFYTHQINLNFLGMLGLVGMAGVVVDSAMLLVEFVNKLLAEGKSFSEALVQGCRLRLRPVLLTTLTTVLGTLPTAYGIGGLDPFIKPMALSMSWGLIIGTLLAFLFTPIFLVGMEEIRKKFS